MTDLTRRGFLTGIATVAAGGVIVAATEQEIDAFTGIGNRVSVLAEEKPFIYSGHNAYVRLRTGQQLYDEHGRIVAVVQDVHVERGMNVTDHEDTYSAWERRRKNLTAPGWRGVDRFAPSMLRVLATVVSV